MWSDYTPDMSVSAESGIRSGSPHWPCTGMHVLDSLTAAQAPSAAREAGKDLTPLHPQLGILSRTSSTCTAGLPCLGYRAEIHKPKHQRHGSQLQGKLLLLLKINPALFHRLDPAPAPPFSDPLQVTSVRLVLFYWQENAEGTCWIMSSAWKEDWCSLVKPYINYVPFLTG